MVYKSIRTNENGKVTICPHCDNEELKQGDYCMVCGNSVINRCADTPDKSDPTQVTKSCRAILPSNARFCPKCGNESVFYQSGWLKDWRSENTKRAIENINMTAENSAIEFNRLKNGRNSG